MSKEEPFTGIVSAPLMNDPLKVPRKFFGAEEALYHAGCHRAGLSYGGVLDDVEGLDVLLRALDHSPALSPSGRQFTWNMLAGITSARIWAKTGWDARPDSLRKVIRNPIVITGIPRSGTTALHKLLSLDPQFQGVEYWLTDFPSPRPPRDKWQDDPRYQAIVHTLTSKQNQQPGLKTKHLELADEVDECLHVLKQTFTCNFFGECIQVPEYDEWWMAQDEGRVAYPWLLDVLKLIGADDSRRWLLKNPGHTWSIEALFESFPDARVIQTHRRPDQALASLCSLVMDMRKIAEGDNADLRALGKRDELVWGMALRRMLAARDKRPDSFVDVWHADINKDPIGVVRDVYGKLGLTLDSGVEATMRACVSEGTWRTRGEHKYNLETFGLTPASAQRAFGSYAARFDLEIPRGANG